MTPKQVEAALNRANDPKHEGRAYLVEGLTRSGRIFRDSPIGIIEGCLVFEDEDSTDWVPCEDVILLRIVWL